jgi:nicotinamide phosphoribosyltransferase
MFQPNPILAADFYKIGHVFQYPLGTSEIYSNLTARSNKRAPLANGRYIDKVVFVGLQVFLMQFLQEQFQKLFFDKPKADVVAEFNRRNDGALGPGSVDSSHIAALHDLGYLPLEIKALPEGSLVPMGVPMLTVHNTLPEFYWLTNFIETALSAEIWKIITCATVAFEYRKLLERWAKRTGSPKDFVLWQGHDFSMRGMSGISDAAQSGMGHLFSFLGTDTIPAIEAIEKFYNGLATFVGGSVPATEHSVMCAGGMEDEKETIRHLIQDVYPSGVVSVVSDTWDFFKVVTETATELKDVILNRQPNALGLAKVVFRPDSGNPADILCGDPKAPAGSPESKGAVECLWEIFSGTETETGHKLLNQRVGLIYGDSITLERAEEIMQRLHLKGFASANVVFGIGSFTYQYLTRDTFGMAMKATSAVVNGQRRALFKDPKTDDGLKRSARGLLKVQELDNGNFVLHNDCTVEQEQTGALQTVFLNGRITKMFTIDEIRAKVNTAVDKYLLTV